MTTSTHSPAGGRSAATRPRRCPPSSNSPCARSRCTIDRLSHAITQRIERVEIHRRIWIHKRFQGFRPRAREPLRRNRADADAGTPQSILPTSDAYDRISASRRFTPVVSSSPVVDVDASTVARATPSPRPRARVPPRARTRSRLRVRNPRTFPTSRDRSRSRTRTGRHRASTRRGDVPGSRRRARARADVMRAIRGRPVRAFSRRRRASSGHREDVLERRAR